MTIAQPISHRLDHLLFDVRTQTALQLYGDYTDALGEQRRQRSSTVPGLVRT